MVKLKPITDKSWLVLSDDGMQRVALLSQQENKFVLIAKDVKTTFRDKAEVDEFFSEDIFANIVAPKEKKDDIEYFVKGYPVDFDTPYEADPEDQLSELPLYAKTENSKVYFAAGYYCLKFPKGWVGGFCPKFSTLTKYEYQGPYKTEKEMKFVLSKSRRCQK